MRTITLPSFSISENGSADVLAALDITSSREALYDKVVAAITKNSRDTRDIVKITERCLRDLSISTKELIALALIKGQELYYKTPSTPVVAPTEEVLTKPKTPTQSDSPMTAQVLASVDESLTTIDNRLDAILGLLSAIGDTTDMTLTKVVKTSDRIKKISKKI